MYQHCLCDSIGVVAQRDQMGHELVKVLYSELARSIATTDDKNHLRGNLDKPLCIVAWSGGPDSTALLHAMLSLNDTAYETETGDDDSSKPAPSRRLQQLRIIAVYIDHGMRPESAVESAQLADYATTLGVKFLAHRLKIIPTNQATAREGRYAALEMIAIQQKASIIVTGHHQLDQVETILQRIIRGTGTIGLRGMSSVRSIGKIGIENTSSISCRAGLDVWENADSRMFDLDNRVQAKSSSRISIVRPLLTVSDSMIQNYIGAHQLLTLDDPSNHDRKYTRSSVRHDVVPILKQINPKIESAILQLSYVARSENDALSQIAQDLAAQASVPVLQTMFSDLSLRVTKEINDQLRQSIRVCTLSLLSEAHPEITWRAILKLCKESYSCRDLSDIADAGKGADHVCISTPCYHNTRVAIEDLKHFIHSDRRTIQTFGCFLQKAGDHIWILPQALYVLCRDISSQHADSVRKELNNDETDAVYVRSVEPGDRIEITCGNGDRRTGKQKVSDFFINKKVPAWSRPLIPICIQNKRIVRIGKLWTAKPIHRNIRPKSR